jgi:general stress protein 26
MRLAESVLMDSINKEQPENVFKNLYGDEALQKVRELAGKAKTCLFCTKIRTGSPFAARPMSVQKVDEHGAFWFLSAEDSHHIAQIREDSSVQMLFQGGSYSDFMTLYGKATLSKDRKKIEELWEPTLKDWFTEGVNDPRITVICVRPRDGYYWDTKHGTPVAFVKRLVGSVIGKTLDDSVEGTLKP